jgi:Cys-tRNA(Pro)/Cys-tRNA(Cys) deacylase
VARKRSGGTPATVALTNAGVPFRLASYDHDPRAASYGLEAAEALGVDPAQVLKTLVANVDGRLAVGVVPVQALLDLKALARALGASKATMADVTDAERATGYVAGGISPFGQKKQHVTVVDETVHLWDTVYVSGGRRGLDVAIAPADLVEVTGAIVADISR